MTEAADAIRSFPPIVDGRARVLILGSMPGERSLAAGEYYAHRHNQFWKIMGTLAGAHPELPYPQRTQRLLAQGIALWDVLAACRRNGSLDANIERDSIQVNAFAELFARYPHIGKVCFNGGTAAQVFRRHVLPTLGSEAARLELERLPSTSPAHAAMRPAEKLERWRAALRTATQLTD